MLIRCHRHQIPSRSLRWVKLIRTFWLLRSTLISLLTWRDCSDWLILASASFQHRTAPPPEYCPRSRYYYYAFDVNNILPCSKPETAKQLELGSTSWLSCQVSCWRYWLLIWQADWRAAIYNGGIMKWKSKMVLVLVENESFLRLTSSSSSTCSWCLILDDVVVKWNCIPRFHLVFLIRSVREMRVMDGVKLNIISFFALSWAPFSLLAGFCKVPHFHICLE